MPSFNFNLLSHSQKKKKTFIIFTVGSHQASKIIESVLQLLKPINASYINPDGDPGTDINDWMSAGVPGVGLKDQDDTYFYFHHTEGILFCLLALTLMGGGE